MEQGYLGRGWLLMEPGLGWTLPLIRSKARRRIRRRGVRSIKRTATQLWPVNGQPSEKTVQDKGGDLLVEPLGNLSCHFDPSPLERGLHYHNELAGRWCRGFIVAHVGEKVAKPCTRISYCKWCLEPQHKTLNLNCWIFIVSSILDQTYCTLDEKSCAYERKFSVYFNKLAAGMLVRWFAGVPVFCES